MIDDYEPTAPHSGTKLVMPEMGRLVSHKRLDVGWRCRWCDRRLEQDRPGTIICPKCDRGELPG